ncbi:MAG: metal-dependent hydrolase [Desulfovibrio sp.]
MNKLAHVLFPVVFLDMADHLIGCNHIVSRMIEASATWLPAGFGKLSLFGLVLGAILPDWFDKVVSNQKRTAHLQYKKNGGEWLSDEEFQELLNGKKDWWGVHRTLSHWWPIPLLLFAIGLEPIAIGWASHLLLDAMTPMGIPRDKPFPDDTSRNLRIPVLSEIKGLNELATVLLVGITFLWYWV